METIKEDLIQKADRKAVKIAQTMLEESYRDSDVVMGWKSIVFKHENKKYVLLVEAAWEKSRWYQYRILEVVEPAIITSHLKDF